MALFVLAIFAVRWSHRAPEWSSVVAASPGQPIVVLGDSFAESAHFNDQFPRRFPGRRIRIDGVGGASLAQSADRYLAGPQDARSLLIILDGQLDDREALPSLERILARMDSGCGRWLYVEPTPNDTNARIGSANYRRQAAAIAAVERKYPGHVVRINDTLRGAGDGSAEDRASVARGAIPTSLRESNDPVHLNGAGYRVLIDQLAPAIERLDGTEPGPCEGVRLDQSVDDLSTG